MAEKGYIDRDDLIKRLELSIDSWSADCNTNAGIMALAYRDVVLRVENLPAADVVPRAEIEEIVLRKMKDRCHACISAEAKRIDREHAKAEVAREIFEVVEEMCIDFCGCFNPLIFAELKKKYTEKGGEEGWLNMR